MAKSVVLWALAIFALQALCFSINVQAGNGKATVAILVKQKVQYGQQIKVVGNADELCNWDYECGRGLTWNTDNNWLLITELYTEKVYQYKAVVVDSNNNEVCYCWQPGGNREFSIPSSYEGKDYLLEITWSSGLSADVEACTVGVQCKKTPLISTVV